MAGVTQALNDSLDDVKQFLHVAPNTLQNYINIYQPAQGAATSVLALNNFANPISFLCGAIQAASRLGAEQSAKLCVQYLAPIVKNRQYNFLPLGQNLFVGATRGRTRSPTARIGCARITFRRNRSAAAPAAGREAPQPAAPPPGPPLAAEAADATEPGRRSAGLMVPPGVGP